MPKGHPLHLYTLLGVLLIGLFWIPREILSLLRYRKNYNERKTALQPSTNGIELDKHSKPKPLAPIGSKQLKEHMLLNQILAIEHLLLPIAENIHYVDLVNLSRTAKSVNELVFPPQDIVFRRAKLQGKSCSDTSKTTCWNCSRQVCHVCTSNPRGFFFHCCLG